MNVMKDEKRAVKRRTNRALVAAAVVGLAAGSRTLLASTNLYWDVNGATAGGSGTATAAGTWDTVVTNWSADPLGASATGTWGGAGSTAVFSAGTGVLGAYTVTVLGNQTTDGITIEEGTVTLSGGQITLYTSRIPLG